MRGTWKGFVALAAVAVCVCSWTGAPAAAQTRSFTVVQLPGTGGGEPSLASDRVGDVYVSAPLVRGQATVGTNGASVWTSRDDGRSFSGPQNLGAYEGGEDSDIATPWNGGGDDRTVYLADLQVWSAAVCVSRDAGATWNGAGPAPDPGHCTVVSQGNYGPSNDREWLTPDANGRVYLTYHEFFSAQPAIFRSDTYGADGFSAGPCGSMVSDPTIEANMLNDVTEGTLVAKPVLDAQGNIYVLVFSSTQQQQAAAPQAGQQAPTVSQAYMMVSNDGCKTWTDYTIFDGSAVGTNSVDFAHTFGVLAIDGAGTLYAIGDGYIGTQAYPAGHSNNIILFTSRDHGQTWSKPLQVDTGDTTFLPSMVGGNRAGQLAIGYYRTLGGATNPEDNGTRWTYTVAESGNADSDHPTFSFTDMGGAGTVYHRGPYNRPTLLDFSSATLGIGGCPLFVWPGDQDPTVHDYVARQTGGCFAGAGKAGGHEAEGVWGGSRALAPSSAGTSEATPPEVDAIPVGAASSASTPVALRPTSARGASSAPAAALLAGVGLPALELLRRRRRGHS